MAVPLETIRQDFDRIAVLPRMAEVRAACAEQLPGSQVRAHLFWRWSLVWRRT